MKRGRGRGSVGLSGHVTPTPPHPAWPPANHPCAPHFRPNCSKRESLHLSPSSTPQAPPSPATTQRPPAPANGSAARTAPLFHWVCAQPGTRSSEEGGKEEEEGVFRRVGVEGGVGGSGGGGGFKLKLLLQHRLFFHWLLSGPADRGTSWSH